MLANALPVTEAATDVVRAWGPAGAVIVCLAGALVYLYMKVSKIQDARVKEAKESADKMVGLAQDMTEVIRDSTIANQQMTAAVQHLRDMFLLIKGS